MYQRFFVLFHNNILINEQFKKSNVLSLMILFTNSLIFK